MREKDSPQLKKRRLDKDSDSDDDSRSPVRARKSNDKEKSSERGKEDKVEKVIKGKMRR